MVSAHVCCRFAGKRLVGMNTTCIIVTRYKTGADRTMSRPQDDTIMNLLPCEEVVW